MNDDLNKYYQMLDSVEMPEWADEYNRIHRYRFAVTLSMLPDVANKNVLEVGSYGLICTILRKEYKDVEVDITFHSPTGPDDIESRIFDWDNSGPYLSYNVDLQHKKLPCNDEKYDFILCAEVIEHMPVDPMHLLCELNRICKTGGKLLLTTPNIASISAVARILRGENPIGYHKFKKSRSVDRHNIEYTPEQVQILLESAGFEIDFLTTENVWDPNDYSKLEDSLSTLDSPIFNQINRGDNIFCMATKKTDVAERWPIELYD